MTKASDNLKADAVEACAAVRAVETSAHFGQMLRLQLTVAYSIGYYEEVRDTAPLPMFVPLVQAIIDALTGQHFTVTALVRVGQVSVFTKPERYVAQLHALAGEVQRLDTEIQVAVDGLKQAIRGCGVGTPEDRELHLERLQTPAQIAEQVEATWQALAGSPAPGVH